jgi:hypothetical protein
VSEPPGGCETVPVLVPHPAANTAVAASAVHVDLNRYPILDLTQVPTEDLDALLAIGQRSRTNPAETIEAG